MRNEIPLAGNSPAGIPCARWSLCSRQKLLGIHRCRCGDDTSLGSDYMQTRLRSIAALAGLSAAVGCNSPQVAVLTGERLRATPGARSVDALWGMALPPVVVRPSSPSDTVQVAISEWKIVLSSIEVESGTVVFHVRNNGTMPHAFEIEGQGVEKATHPIRAGADSLIALRLEKGRYEVYCPIGEGTSYAHKAMGMVASLNVGRGMGDPSSASPGDTQEHARTNGRELSEYKTPPNDAKQSLVDNRDVTLTPSR